MRPILIISALLILFCLTAAGVYFGYRYWMHRFDQKIERYAADAGVDRDLVWSVIYEETYFRPWMLGADAEIGLMQVTPTVARMWVKETARRDLETMAAEDVNALMLDVDRNIAAGCWYLAKVRERYRGYPAENALALAAYNAGPSRVVDWVSDTEIKKISEKEFITHIEISSTRNYVNSILKRYRELKD